MDPSVSAAPPTSSFPAHAHQLAIDEHLASRERDRSDLDRDRSEGARGGLDGSRSGISSPGETFLPTPSGSPPLDENGHAHPSQSHGPGPKLSHLLHADHSQQNEQAQAYAPYQQQQPQAPPGYPSYQAYGMSNLPPAQHYRAPLPSSYQSYPYNRGPPVAQMQHHSSGPPPPPPLLSGPNSNGAGGYQSHSGPPSRTGTPNGTSQQQHQRQLQLQQQHQQQAQMMQNSRFGFPPIGSRQAGVDMNLAPLSLPPAPSLSDQGGPSWPPSSTSLNPYNREGPPIPQLGGAPALPPLANAVGNGGPKRDRTEFDDELEQQDDDDDEGDEEEDDEWHEGTGSQPGAQKPKGGPKSAKKPKVVRQSLDEMVGGTPNGGKQPVKKFTCPHASCGRAFARNFNLQSHIKSHMGVRDFKCPECPKSFSRRHDCARHCIAVHHYDKESGKKSAGAG